jgi:hypothetical protein
MLKRGQVATKQSLQPLPTGTPISKPYWLRHEPTAGMARVENAELIGCLKIQRPLALHTFRGWWANIRGCLQTLQVLTDAREWASQNAGLENHSTGIAAPRQRRSSLAPGASRAINVEVRAARAGTSAR